MPVVKRPSGAGYYSRASRLGCASIQSPAHLFAAAICSGVMRSMNGAVGSRRGFMARSSAGSSGSARVRVGAYPHQLAERVALSSGSWVGQALVASQLPQIEPPKMPPLVDQR